MQKEKMTASEWEQWEKSHEMAEPEMTMEEWEKERRKRRIKKDISSALKSIGRGAKKYGPKALKYANEVGKRAYAANAWGGMFPE